MVFSTESEINNDQLGVWFPKVRTGTGTDSYTVRLVRALCKRGVRAEVSWLPHRAEYMPWLVRSLHPPEWANIVHTNSAFFSYFLRTCCPVVVTIHHCVHNSILTPYKSLAARFYHHLWIRPVEMSSVSRAAAVTAVSQYTADHSKSVYGRPDIVAIHNWIDPEVFRPDGRDEPNDPFRLLFVGTFNARKGADVLPEIIRLLGDDFQLHYTAPPGRVPKALAELDNTCCIGRLDGESALVRAYHQCDALLFPTRLEGFGLVALEAQACGRPVIGFNSPSVPEVVEHNATGFLCKPDDLNCLAACARSLRDSPGQWRRMAKAARRRAEYGFDEGDSVSKYISLYKELAKQYGLV